MSDKISPREERPSVKTKAVPDDFLQIRGINSKISARLQEAGVTAFAQLAALSVLEIAERLGPKVGVAATQIAKQDWIGQARLLAAEPLEDGFDSAHLQATSYVVELYLDADRRVNRTRILDVKTGDEDAWPSWDENRLLDFFANRPELDLSAAPAVDLSESSGSPGPETLSPESDTAKSFFQAVLSSAQLDIIPNGLASPSAILGRDQPFQVRLAFAMANAGTSQRTLDYTAVVTAKSMGCPDLLDLAQADGATDFDASSHKEVTLNVPSENGATLRPGMYRTQALLTVFDSQAKGRPIVLRSLVEGSLLQVY